MILNSSAILVMIAGLAGVTAQDNIATQRAHAAGYKAVFTCGGIFNGGKSPEMIADDELTGVAPLYAERFDDVGEVVVDHANKRVSVVWGETLPPRISQWRPHLGCVSLPVGATTKDADNVRRIDLPVHAAEDTGAPWKAKVQPNEKTGNDALDEVIRHLFEGGHYGANQKTSALLIASSDEIIAEHYKAGHSPLTAQRTWSIAKSIAASVVGVGVQKGLLEVTEKASLDAWSRPRDPRQSITIQNLLNMASGLDSNRSGSHTPDLYFGGALVSDTATRSRLEVAPGTRWKYANIDTLLAIRALRERIGDTEDYLKFPFEELLYKIGMTHTKLETDWDDNFIMSSQVWTTSRDLARLGLLYLNDGVWNGERILPAGWASYASSRAGPQPGGDYGYGAQWWLVRPGVYAALGNRGQKLYILPDEGLVIVRRGYDPAGGQGLQDVELVTDILSALGR